MAIRPEALARTRGIAASAAAVSFVVGAVGLLGWIFDNRLLKTGLTGEVSMKVNTAVGLCLSAAALGALSPTRRAPGQALVARAFAVVVVLLGALTLSQHVFGWNLGIDELLFTEPGGEAATASPGRMGPPACTSFMLLGAGLFLFDVQTRRGTAPTQWLALVACVIALFAILGYVTGAEQLYGIARYTGIAVHTSVAFLLLGVGLFLARAEREPARLLALDNPGGHVARTMLPAAVLLPLIIGWLRTVGQRHGLYDTAFGRALLLLTLIVLFTGIVWRVARRLSSVAAQRAAAERATSRARAEADRLALENIETLAQRASLMESERAARLDAERAARLKDEFLATLSHELRTPLNAILGWTAIARQTHGQVPELARPLETIERNARLQAQLIEDLLDISRIVSGQMRLAMEAVELPLVVHAAVTAVTPAAIGKQIRLDIDLDPDVVSITGDAARLQQVLWNLLSNAVKFTPQGGRVQLGVRRRGALVELAVSDDGIGIAPEFLPHVFDRFRQADSSITRRQGGLGLGLSIVKQLVELHGGTVTVASAGEHRGASFVVLLPLHAGSEDAELRAARTPLPPAGPSTRAP
jgi:signal transduction histidine kinase